MEKVGIRIPLSLCEFGVEPGPWTWEAPPAPDEGSGRTPLEVKRVFFVTPPPDKTDETPPEQGTEG